MSRYIETFIESEQRSIPTKKFVEEEVLPRVQKQLEDFGDGWLTEDCEIHAREVEAMLFYIQGECK